MECKSQWRLLAASIALDVVLRFFFGIDEPEVHLVLAASAVCMASCAVSIHLLEWLGELLRAASVLANDILGLTAKRRLFAELLIAEFLFYVYLAYQLGVRLWDFRNIPDRPCLCGFTRPDGSRPTLREHCWKRR